MTIDTKHLQEWTVGSGVDPELTSLNVRSLHGTEAYSYLLHSDKVPRRNDGRLTSYWLKKYLFTEEGGWWCGGGVDICSLWRDTLFGCLKPNKPRRDPNNPGKRIKYEHPPRAEMGMFALKIPELIQERIAQRYGMLESLRLHMDNPVYNLKGEKLSVYAQFWNWVLIHPEEIPLTITEGAKKAGALLTAGYCAIALPGVNSGYRFNNNSVKPHRELVPGLKELAKGGRKFSLAFDQDSKRKTIKNVGVAIERLSYLLKEEGCEVEVASWNPDLGKGIDDLIVNHGTEVLTEILSKACCVDVWKARKYRQLTHTPHASVNSRHLGALNIPDFARLVAIKSPKGTGKTESMIALVAQAVHEGQRVIILTHRVQLGEALCKRFGINYVTELRNSEEGEIFGYGLCVDSLHPESQARFKAEDWEGCLIISDEVEQMLWHLLNSSTCRKNRVSILRSFKKLFQGAEKAVIADADLSDVSVEYIGKLMGVEPYIIRNDFIFDEPWNVYRYQKDQHLLDSLTHHIRATGTPFVCVSGQKDKSVWGTKNLEAFLTKEFPDRKFIRIDSESISDPNHLAYGIVAHLNELEPGVIPICSPSIETGVSIDIREHFTAVYGLAQGVQAENSVRQALSRVREPIDRHIFAAPFGIGRVGNGSTSFKSLLSSQNKIMRGNLKLLEKAEMAELLDTDNPDELTNFQPETMMAWGKMAVRHNAGMLSYADQIFSGLEEEGHIIIPVSDDDLDNIQRGFYETLKAMREKRYLEERTAICNAEPFESETEYKASKEKIAKTLEERRRERQWEMCQRYPECTPELIKLDDEGYYQQLKLHYYLHLGRRYLPERDKAKAKSQIEGKALFSPDFNRSQYGMKIHALELLGIPGLLSNLDREFKNSDEDLQRLKETAISNNFGLRALGLGTYKETDSPVECYKRLIGKLGSKADRVGRESRRGHRDWIYKNSPDLQSDAILRHWKQLDEEMAQTKQSLVPQEDSLKNVSQGGNNNRELLGVDTASLIQDLNTCEPEALQDMVRSFLRADWWAEVRIDVWSGVKGAVRRLIDALDVEVSYGF